MDNFSTGRRENLTEILAQIDFREADILDLDAMKQACAGADYVLHQAAIPSVPKSVLDPIGSNRANVDGTVNVLVAARDAKVKRVIYAASSSAYGDTPTLPKHEGMTPDPISPYAVAKLASERYMISFYRCYGLETVSLRYFNIFGPRQDPIVALLRRAGQVHHPDAEAGSSPQSSAMASRAGTSPTSTTPSRPTCWPARLLRRKWPARSSMWPRAAGSRSMRHSSSCRSSPRTPVLPSMPRNAAATSSIPSPIFPQAEKHLGYKPKVNFEDGLQRTVDWYRSQSKAAGA